MQKIFIVLIFFSALFLFCEPRNNSKENEIPETKNDFSRTEMRKMSGRQVMENRCTLCHDYYRIMEAEKTKLQWQQTITAMESYGAVLNTMEKDSLINFLNSKNVKMNRDLNH